MIGLSDGAATVRAAIIEGLTPPRERTVSEWAKEERVVSPDSGSPQPGRWSNELAPYLVEPMDCCGLQDPSTDVAFMGAAQIGKSSVGENFTGYGICDDPAPMLIVLPTLDEAKKYNRLKLSPMLDATPALRARMMRLVSRDEQGSSVFYKKFRGASITIAGANASAGLQMISVKRVLLEEVTEFPDDLDGRGDPGAMALARTLAWSNRAMKRVQVSTPGVKGACRITEAYSRSDQRRFYVPCPHCGAYFLPRFEYLKWEADAGSPAAYLACPAHGCVIEHHAKRRMVRPDGWLKTYSGDGCPGDVVSADEFAHLRNRASAGRQPGFHVWQVVSPFVSWDEIILRYRESVGNYLTERVFSQQILGEAFEEKGEAPDDEMLFLRREPYRLGAMPVGALVLTGAVDVQSNRLEWAVWGWGAGLTSFLVDKGIVEGDPDSEETWRLIDAILPRTYAMPSGRTWPVEIWCVDSGYKSHAVYAFTRGRPRVIATNGLDGHLLPMLGTPKKVDVNWKGKPIKGGAMLYPMGTFPLKSLLYSGLRKTIDGPNADGTWPPGAVRLSDDIDRDYVRQMTAEYLADVATRDGRIKKQWKKKRDVANEALDLWVMARAGAWHIGLDRYTPERWRVLAAERGAVPDPVQGDLLGPGPMMTKPADVPGRASPSAQATTVQGSVARPQQGRRISRSSYL